jgi:hypothetical protein
MSAINCIATKQKNPGRVVARRRAGGFRVDKRIYNDRRLSAQV